jgi:hypothetical protein
MYKNFMLLCLIFLLMGCNQEPTKYVKPLKNEMESYIKNNSMNVVDLVVYKDHYRVLYTKDREIGLCSFSSDNTGKLGIVCSATTNDSLFLMICDGVKQEGNFIAFMISDEKLYKNTKSVVAIFGDEKVTIQIDKKKGAIVVPKNESEKFKELLIYDKVGKVIFKRNKGM